VDHPRLLAAAATIMGCTASAGEAGRHRKRKADAGGAAVKVTVTGRRDLVLTSGEALAEYVVKIRSQIPVRQCGLEVCVAEDQMEPGSQQVFVGGITRGSPLHDAISQAREDCLQFTGGEIIFSVNGESSVEGIVQELGASTKVVVTIRRSGELPPDARPAKHARSFGLVLSRRPGAPRVSAGSVPGGVMKKRSNQKSEKKLRFDFGPSDGGNGAASVSALRTSDQEGEAAPSPLNVSERSALNVSERSAADVSTPMKLMPSVDFCKQTSSAAESSLGSTTTATTSLGMLSLPSSTGTASNAIKSRSTSHIRLSL